MQASLFDSDKKSIDSKNPSTDVLVSAVSKVESKEKVDFQKVIEKSKILKLRLEFTSSMENYANEQAIIRMQPQWESLRQELWNEMVSLDKCYDNRLFKFTHKRREKLANIITEKAYALSSDYNYEEADSYIKKYLPELTEEEQELATEASIHMFEKMFGIQFDEEDFKGGQPDLEKMQEKYGDKFADLLNGASPRNEAGTKRKKTKKQLEKEEARLAEEKLLNADIQGIFKELAKKIHPDTEIDESKKAEKQELMKQLVNARDENDIFELLRLRFSVFADMESMNIFDKSSLKRLTKMIREKNKWIEQQIAMLEYESPILSKIRLGSKTETKIKMEIDNVIDLQIGHIKETIEDLIRDTKYVAASNKNINNYIDNFQLDDDDEYGEYDEYDEFDF